MFWISHILTLMYQSWRKIKPSVLQNTYYENNGEESVYLDENENKVLYGSNIRSHVSNLNIENHTFYIWEWILEYVHPSKYC